MIFRRKDQGKISNKISQLTKNENKFWTIVFFFPNVTRWISDEIPSKSRCASNVEKNKFPVLSNDEMTKDNFSKKWLIWIFEGISKSFSCTYVTTLLSSKLICFMKFILFLFRPYTKLILQCNPFIPVSFLNLVNRLFYSIERFQIAVPTKIEWNALTFQRHQCF
jgi:hypothetical protein